MIQFLLAYILPHGRFAGRNCNAHLPLGTVFNALGLHTRRSTEDDGPPEVQFVRHIRLTVESIELYGHMADVLSPGHTAALRLSGADLDSVAGILAAEPPCITHSLLVTDAFPDAA